MRRQRRRQEAHDLVRRFTELPPTQAGRITTILVTNTLISLALQLVLLATYTRARRVYLPRHDRTRRTAHAALTRPVLTLTCANGVHLVCTQVLLSRWVRQATRRAETSTQPHEDQPPSS